MREFALRRDRILGVIFSQLLMLANSGPVPYSSVGGTSRLFVLKRAEKHTNAHSLTKSA